MQNKYTALFCLQSIYFQHLLPYALIHEISGVSGRGCIRRVSDEKF
ncbi:Uncharacterized protein dnm_094560 [Desulfonema magnum]|uniref:Uncharacterized protein n=1 Tax=Desulfonema magnum TaxID=45655 RepID=A0A975BY87_9BACT|nr:Uncharacterized protein dnm_094560 [Desulfonema magnum]